MNIIDILNTRYATKKFDPSKSLTEEEINQLEEILRLAPSSTNNQAWKFIVATTQEGKARIAKSAHGMYAFNESKILDAGAVVVFAARTDVTQEYLQHLGDVEEAAGRFATPEARAAYHGSRTTFANMHKYDLRDMQHWLDKQVYLNMGNFLLGVATMGLDSVAIEGVDMKVLNEEFDLNENELTATVVVAVGHRSEDDFNAKLSKSRLPKEEVIVRI